MALPVRLQPKRVPDAVNRRLEQSGLLGHLPHAPMRAVFWFRLQRLTHQLGHALIADWPRTSQAQLVVQPGYILFQKPLSPLAQPGR